MLRYFILIILLFPCLRPIYGQSDFAKSEVTKLIIKSDSPLDGEGIPQLLIGSTFVNFKPVDLTQSGNDYEGNIYAFGPTTGNLRMFGKTYLMVLVPGETSIIYVHHKKGGVEVSFEGAFKDVFDDSDLIRDFTNKVLGYVDPNPDYELYTDADRYRDRILSETAERIALYLEDSGLEGFSKTLALSNIDFFIKSYLIEYNICLYNQNAGLDTTQTKQHIPTRTLSYYEKLIEPKLNDTLSLAFSPYYELMSAIVQDSLMVLPDINVDGPKAYGKVLRDYLSDYIGERDGLFYDMVIATVYINKLDKREPLTDAQKQQVEDYFENNDLVDYIFHENDHMLQNIENEKRQRAVYLESSEQRGDDLMRSILSLRESKITIVDFWATWCGPCIEGFREYAHVKKKYDDNSDVRFIYITDESSLPKLWHDYVKTVGGEHHYIYREQMLQIYDDYDFNRLPTYLLYNKKGELIKQVRGHIDVHELEEIIQRNLE